MALNTMIVAAITNFSGTTTPDKNGENPVMLQCIAGTMPNRNVLSGTVAQRAGFEVGKTYLVNIRETGFDDTFGPDYTWIKIMELTSGLDIVRAAKELGDARIQFIPRPDGFDQFYRRKADAVESNRTRRIRDGHYHPTYPTTTVHHESAQEVKLGTSVGSGGTIIREGAYGNGPQGATGTQGFQQGFTPTAGGEDEFPEPPDEGASGGMAPEEM